MFLPRESGVRWSWYFQGVKDNLELLAQLYGDSWVMRLYYDLDPADHQLQKQLCELACTNNNIDLCYIRLVTRKHELVNIRVNKQHTTRHLPGTPVTDASKIYAMNWRFFPTLDPQVKC